MPLTSKEAILGLDDHQVVSVFVKPWNDSVFIRTMTGFERDHFEASMAGEEGERSLRMDNFRAKLAAICLSDEKGKPIFTEEDVRKLGQKCSQALLIITKAAMELNGMTPEDQDKLVKNSESTPNADGDSPSV